MKTRLIVYSKKGINTLTICKHMTDELVKDFDIFYRPNQETYILDVLNGFDGKMILYSDLVEKLCYDLTNAPQWTLRYSKTRYKPKTINVTRDNKNILKFLEEEHGGEWRRLNWLGYKRKEKKKSSH